MKSVAMNDDDATPLDLQSGPGLSWVVFLYGAVTDSSIIIIDAQITIFFGPTGPHVIPMRAGNIDQRSPPVINVHEIDKDLYGIAVIIIFMEVARFSRSVKGKIANDEGPIPWRYIPQEICNYLKDTFIENHLNTFRHIEQRVLQANELLR